MSPARRGDWSDAYKEVGKLGAGGYARVIRARHRTDGTEVAIKISYDQDEARPRMRREIDEQGNLRHDHVMAILAAGNDWYAMPLAVGQLADLASELSNDERILVVDQIAAGLACAHAAGCVHRDVTPKNILCLCHDGPARWAIGDFGLVKRPPGETSGPATRGARGTRGFVAPGVIVIGAHGADHRADIYSLGRVVAFMVTAALS